MSDYERALLIAVLSHKDQTRRNGDPYITHPVRVAGLAVNSAIRERASATRIEQIRIVAILHDVVEDTHVDLEDLEHAGFPRTIIDAVDALTRRKEEGESYRDFIDRVKKNELGRLIKIADLQDNISDLPEDHGLRKRYTKALVVLDP